MSPDCPKRAVPNGTLPQVDKGCAAFNFDYLQTLPKSLGETCRSAGEKVLMQQLYGAFKLHT